MCWGAIVTSFKLSETREWFLNYFEIQSIIHWLKLNLKFIPIRCLLIIFTPIKNIWVSWKKLNIPSQFSTQFQRVYHGIILLKYSRWFCVHPSGQYFAPLHKYQHKVLLWVSSLHRLLQSNNLWPLICAQITINKLQINNILHCLVADRDIVSVCVCVCAEGEKKALAITWSYQMLPLRNSRDRNHTWRKVHTPYE